MMLHYCSRKKKEIGKKEKDKGKAKENPGATANHSSDVSIHQCMCTGSEEVQIQGTTHYHTN